MFALVGCGTAGSGTSGDGIGEDGASDGCDQGAWDDCYDEHIGGASCDGDCSDLADCWGDAWADLASCLSAESSCSCSGSTCDDLDQKADDCHSLADCYAANDCSSSACDGGTCSAVGR